MRVSAPRGVDRRFLVEDFEPAYLVAARRGELRSRAEEALAGLACCRACPRECRVDRTAGPARLCGVGRHARVTSAFPHFGEEDCLRGRRGSGTIFFAGCNLRCVFCQNWEISQRPAGVEVDAGDLATVALALQERGCHNLNLVTPEHVVPQVIEALAEAVPRGLRLPVVYNTSAYDSLESLARLDGLVDVYMPDFKLWERESAKRLLGAKDYPERARAAIAEMHRQVGVLRFDRDGLAVRGVLVRHLVMPGKVSESAAIFEWLARQLSPDTFVNIMDQYRPDHRVGEVRADGSRPHADLARFPRRDELEAAYAAARRAGLWRFDERRHRLD
jgi:putative pyruvate formate lyase activating enzyme